MKILLVEDDTEISEMLKNFLITENYEVVTAYDGESACERFFADEYSIVLLDLMIPKISGMEVMKTIRASSTVPIMIISAKDTDSDKALGLGLGADDYVTKPFSVTEVLARIKANIRRNTQYAAGAAAEQDIITIGDLVLNTGDYSVSKGGRKIELTAKEFEITASAHEKSQEGLHKGTDVLAGVERRLSGRRECGQRPYQQIAQQDRGQSPRSKVRRHGVGDRIQTGGFEMNMGTRAKLKEITDKLSDILENDSAEQVMVFTDDKVLMDLCGQINLLLLDRQKMKADFRKQEIASRKMLANISHDIKTPLTVILGYLEIMRLRSPQDEHPASAHAESGACARNGREDGTLAKVEAKAKQVMELIDQFFTLAKLESGDKKIEMTKININELCRENILGFYELLIHKDFQVEIAIPEQTVFVMGDRDAINRILNNLLSNVIRYGSDGKYVGLFLREEGGHVFVDIVDKGKGIEKQFAASVFERLYTMEDSRSRSIQGNGLGLTIAKKLADQMGGDVLLESEPGVRTVFSVRLKRYYLQ